MAARMRWQAHVFISCADIKTLQRQISCQLCLLVQPYLGQVSKPPNICNMCNGLMCDICIGIAGRVSQEVISCSGAVLSMREQHTTTCISSDDTQRNNTITCAVCNSYQSTQKAPMKLNAAIAGQRSLQ